MRFVNFALGIALLTASLSFCSSYADELVIPVGQQGADKSSLEVPSKGLTKEVVEAKFGSPTHKTEAVGSPPIFIWEYPSFRVYFESNKVIHTVLKPRTELESPVESPSVDQ